MSATSMCSTLVKTYTGTQAVNHDVRVNLKVKRRDTGIALLSGLCRSRRSRLGGNGSLELRVGEAATRSEAFVAVCRRERRGGQ